MLKSIVYYITDSHEHRLPIYNIRTVGVMDVPRGS